MQSSRRPDGLTVHPPLIHWASLIGAPQACGAAASLVPIREREREGDAWDADDWKDAGNLAYPRASLD